MNDVVLVTGAMQRFLERRGELLHTYRLPAGGGGEHALKAVRSEAARLKSSHAADGIDFMGQLVDRIGSMWLTGVFPTSASRV